MALRRTTAFAWDLCSLAASRARAPERITERPRARSLVCPRAAVAMALALAAAVWAFSSPSATLLTVRTRMPAGTAPQMCTTEMAEKPEAPTGATEGSAYSLHLRPRQTHPEEHVARVLMMVCSVSAVEAASLATQTAEVRVGIWERAIAEHAYEGMTAQGVLVDLMPAYVHRGEALTAVKADGMALKYASPELQADREVVLAAVRQNDRALWYVSPELKADREVVLAAVQQRGDALEDASPELWVDREVVLAAVRQYGPALKYASPELQADREVVLAAVQQDGRALRHASEELRADREVVLTAMQHQDYRALHYVSPELRADCEVVLERSSRVLGS